MFNSIGSFFPADLEQLEFKKLSYNLLEIKAFLYSQDKITGIGKLLTTSSDGQYLYCTKPLFVRIWLWIKNYFYPETEEQKNHKLSQALIETLDGLFDRCIRRLDAAYNSYVEHYSQQVAALYAQDERIDVIREQHLDLEGQPLETVTRVDLSNTPLDEYQVGRIRVKVTTYYERLMDVWGTFIKCQQWKPDSDQLASSCQEHFNLLKEALPVLQNSNLRIYTKTWRQHFKRVQAMINLEGALQQPVPITLLAKWFHPEGLSRVEENRLTNWIQKLNRHAHEITSKEFKKALQEMILILNKDGRHSITFEQLTLKFDEAGCQLMAAEDSDHLSWRRSLTKGVQIMGQGKTYILGDPIQLERTNDHYLVFHLQDDPHRVLRIGRNCLELPLEILKFKDPKKNWGITPISIVDVDPKGKWMVVEKLQMFHPSYQWVSQSYQLSTADLQMALILANHMRWGWSNQLTPKDLNIGHIGRDVQGGLKSTHLLPCSGFNYIQLEQWCIDLGRVHANHTSDTQTNLSQTNWFAVAFMMHVSELHSHLLAEFYRGAVSYAILNEKTDLVGRPLPEEFPDQGYKDHAEVLSKKAIQLADECFKSVKLQLEQKKEHLVEDDQKLKSQVKNVLIELYKASPVAAMLIPDLASQVIEVCVNKNSIANYQIKNQFDKYYQEQIKLLKKLNQSSQMNQESI